MPTKPRRYPKQLPKLQFQIVKEIALNGHLSNIKLKERLEVSHPVISDAIKSLMDRRLVEISYTDSTEHKDGKPEKYYTLTKRGLEEFIKRNPAPEEFFQALLKSYNLRPQTGWLNTRTMSIEDFELHYELYKQKYLGYASTYAYIVQTLFLNKLYEQWLAEYRPALFAQYHLKNIINVVHSPFIGNCYEKSLEISDLNGITIIQKVLECLAIHRHITEKQIEEFLNLKQKNEEKPGRKTFRYPDFYQDQIEFHYAITPDNIRRVIDKYTIQIGDICKRPW
jgi:DNA-binding PadR family transcriptional regulator